MNPISMEYAPDKIVDILLFLAKEIKLIKEEKNIK